MTVDEIKERYGVLNEQLHIALSTMDKQDTVKNIRQQILNLQEQCPHTNDKICPYCGRRMSD